MKALILAAGYATRLYPLTRDYPKPLLKVGRKPIIEHILNKLFEIDAIDEIIIVTNSRFIGKFRKWKKSLRASKRITLVDDLTKDFTDRRGAIGDIGFVLDQRRLKEGLLVVGGDNLFDEGLKAFLSFSRVKKPHPVIGVYRIESLKDAAKYGVVSLDTAGRVRSFKEKPKHPASRYVAMCLYYFPAASIKLVRDYMHRVRESDATGFYISWLLKRARVYGFVFGGRWLDIGDKKVYNKVKDRF